MAGKLGPYLAIFSGLLALLLAGVCGWLVAPRIFDKRAEWKMLLVETTLSEDFYQSWLENTNVRRITFHIFNLTNPEALLVGEKLVYTEHGPYVYDEIWEKFDVEYLTETQDRIRFKDKKYYMFNEQESVGSETDVFNVPNVPLITAATLLYARVPKESQTEAENIIASLVQDTQETIIKTDVSVSQLLFSGWSLNKQDWNGVTRWLPEFDATGFGFYYQVNGTDDQEYVLYTGSGKDNSPKFGRIFSWNGRWELQYWRNESGLAAPSCNSFSNATDGSLFSPKKTIDSVLKIFKPSQCRAMDYEFLVESEHLNIPTYRFVPTGANLQSPDENAENSCFCSPISANLSTECFSGAYRLFSCKNMPLVYSAPHFLEGPDQSQFIDMPKPSEKTSFYDLEPETGYMIRSSRLSQMNVEIQRLRGYDSFNALNITGRTSLLLPVYWSDETEEISEDMANLLYDEFIGPVKTFIVVRYVTVGLAAAVLAAGLGTLAFKTG